MAPLVVLAALLGLAVGSFLNVVIHRVPRGQSLLRPGSHCPHCAAPVRARHNVPVLSWLWLRGRCADCGGRVSPRYVLVEAGTAALFAIVTVHFGLSTVLPAYLYLAAVAVALAAIDLDVRRLPDAIVLPSYAVAIGLLTPAAYTHPEAAVRGLLAMAALWALYFAIRFAHPRGMGYGDVKLAGVLGLYLGWLGWGAVWVGAFAGFLLGALAGSAVLLAQRQRVRGKVAIPFGPYMLAGALLALFVATPISTWYGSLLVPTI
jgi:leader peptidase (prepilin peptidase) / N-methyltransferase